MYFADLKKVINRSKGRHEKAAMHIGLSDAVIVPLDSPILDCFDDYLITWIAPGTIGKSTVTDSDEPCIEIHLEDPNKC